MPDPYTPGLLARLPEPPRKVALLRASRIGDFINATPAFRALRMALPAAEITMITLPILRDIVERSPLFDRYVAFPGYPGLAEQFFDARSALRFFAAMQAEHFDLAIQMQGSGVNSNPFMLMLGAQTTAGFIRPADSAGLLDAALPLPEHGYEVERILALTGFLGAPPQGIKPEYPLWPQDFTDADRILAGSARPLIGLHPSARDRSRRWDPQRFAASGKTLRERFGGTLIVLGEQAETDLMEDIGRRTDGPYLNLAGRLSLAQLGAVIARLAILISNDTGPAHIAYALATPTVTIFSTGDPARNGPIWNGPFKLIVPDCLCKDQNLTPCPVNFACLHSVTVEQVVEAAESLLKP